MQLQKFAVAAGAIKFYPWNSLPSDMYIQEVLSPSKFHEAIEVHW